MPFTDSPVRRTLRRYLPPAIAPQNESTATAESLRGTGLMVEGFNRRAARERSGAGRVTGVTLRPCDPATVRPGGRVEGGRLASPLQSHQCGQRRRSLPPSPPPTERIHGHG
jgi:hypothetical protein